MVLGRSQSEEAVPLPQFWLPQSVGSVFIIIYPVNMEGVGVPEVLNVQPHLLRADKYIQYLKIYL